MAQFLTACVWLCVLSAAWFHGIGAAVLVILAAGFAAWKEAHQW